VTARVYITNDTGLDFTKAEAYGELCRLTYGPIDIFRPEATKREIELKLSAFRNAEDYLLVSGSSLAAAFAAAFLATCGDSDEEAVVRFLLFDSKRREYFVRTIQL
jgi:glyoxylate carboligase